MLHLGSVTSWISRNTSSSSAAPIMPSAPMGVLVVVAATVIRILVTASELVPADQDGESRLLLLGFDFNY